MRNKQRSPRALPKQRQLAIVTGMATMISIKAEVQERYGVRLGAHSLTANDTKLAPDNWRFEITVGDHVPPDKRRQVKAYITGATAHASRA